MAIKDITGKTFGLLTAIKSTDRPVDVKNGTYWECLCKCGSKHNTTLNSLQSGKSSSCGCLSKEKWKLAATKHGLSNHPIRKVWEAMLDRCTNPKNKRYKNYGERGIKVCVEWLDLEAFAEDMLPFYKKGLTLDRIDNNQGYSKTKATDSTARNRRFLCS